MRSLISSVVRYRFHIGSYNWKEWDYHSRAPVKQVNKIHMAGKFNIKCGVIDADGRISQDKGFKFFTWTATSNTSAENQFTLAQRVQELYPDMKEPYQIVCIGK